MIFIFFESSHFRVGGILDYDYSTMFFQYFLEVLYLYLICIKFIDSFSWILLIGETNDHSLYPHKREKNLFLYFLIIFLSQI